MIRALDAGSIVAQRHAVQGAERITRFERTRRSGTRHHTVF